MSDEKNLKPEGLAYELNTKAPTQEDRVSNVTIRGAMADVPKLGNKVVRAIERYFGKSLDELTRGSRDSASPAQANAAERETVYEYTRTSVDGDGQAQSLPRTIGSPLSR